MSLSSADQRLLRLFTACVLGNWDEVRRLRVEAGPPGEPDPDGLGWRRWREALLQVHLFAGIPRQIEAGSILLEAGGLGTPEADEIEEGHGSDPIQVSRGRELFDRIYAGDSPAVRAMLARAHPELERWVLEHAYGRVLSRPGLAADRRELLAVVALAALGQDRQLASHARGALRCGARAGEFAAALDAVEDLVEAERPGRIAEARRLLAKIR